MTKKIALILFALFLVQSVYAAQSLADLQSISKALDKRKQDLDTREKNVRMKEERLKALEDSLVQKDVEIRKMQTGITARLKEIKVQEDKNLDKIAKDYSSAKAKSAAVVVVKMDLDKAVQIFQRLPAMTAGKLLSAMALVDPVFTARLSEKFTPQTIPGVTAPATGTNGQ